MSVGWFAQWYCECGAEGQAHFEDESDVEADHDCEYDEDSGAGAIGWEGRAECGRCGWVLEVDFDDGCWVDSGHVCGEDVSVPAGVER
ncbi:hypothetical protein ABZ747_34465 [Kitasatospora cineracea]|uniref:hypothetical protein n=1 Tax=Kitasatospora cineracea TaxID=88074 RepID=UPI0034080FD2